MDERRWIPANIQQRNCVVFCKLDENHPEGCKCYREKSLHTEPDTIYTEQWSLSKNTKTEPCKDFRRIGFERSDKSSKFVRIDVETDMSTTETLLLDVWKLPKPKWILSVMGDVFRGNLRKVEEFQTQIRSVLKTLSDGQNIWITNEGLNFGVAKIIGEVLKNPADEALNNVTSVGIFAWGGFEDGVRETLQDDKQQLPDKEGNTPSELYPHHLLVDDGTWNPAYAHQSFQDFRMRLETYLSNHTDLSTSIPLVTLLYGGWSYVIDGVKTAIQNNIPIVVLKGTGGFADVLGNVFEVSKEDKMKATTNDDMPGWTGTVIDDVLRKTVEAEFQKVHGKPYKAGQHVILQCLQKRELISVVDIDKEENTLTNAIIMALLKCKTLPEILRMLDYYMPTPLFEGESAAVDAIQALRPTEKALSETTGLFLVQAILMDQSECAQFIIDYEGVDLVHVMNTMSAVFSTKGDDMFPSCSLGNLTTKNEVFQVLFIWAVRKRKQKCAALFWKKGKHLLASSLVTSLVFRTMKETEENIGDKKTLEEHAILFENRAIGLINECYDNQKEETLNLIQSQSLDNMWNPSLLACCLEEGNRKIFATEAFKKYIERVWNGKVNPPHQNTYKKPTSVLKSMKSDKCDVLKRIATAPVTTYVLNLVFYIAFLVIFGHTLLFELGPKYSVLEGILVIWWITFVWEEIRQFVRTGILDQKQVSRKNCQCCYGTTFLKFRSHFLNNYWNILDFVCLFFFLVGGVLIAVYHTDNTKTDVYQAARFFLSVDIMVFTWRLLQHVAIFRILGPTLEMIYQMVKDLFPFLVIMFVFIISQGLAAHALLYPKRDWTAEAILDIPKSAFWNVFGELGLDVIEASEAQDDCSSNPLLFENDTKDECPSKLGKYAVPFLLGMYMLLMNVLLLNLLIARFSFTFQKVHDQTEWLAAWQTARVTLEYYRKPPLPPPLNIFFDIPYLIYRYTCGKKNKVSPDEKPKDDEEMTSWERSMAEYYLASAEFKSGSERISILRENKERNQDAAIMKMLQSIKQQSSNTDDNRRTENEPVKGRVSDKETTKLRIEIQGLDKRMQGLESALQTTLTEMRRLVVTVDRLTLGDTTAPAETCGTDVITLDGVDEEDREEHA